MIFFKDITSRTKDKTKQNDVIMGRITYLSIPDKYRPLKNRFNCVISRQDSSSLGFPEEVMVAESFDRALQLCGSNNQVENIFVIGGEQVYTEAIQHPLCDVIHYTRLETNIDCTVFFPEIPKNYSLTEKREKKEENGIQFEFQTYTRTKSTQQ